MYHGPSHGSPHCRTSHRSLSHLLVGVLSLTLLCSLLTGCTDDDPRDTDDDTTKGRTAAQGASDSTDEADSIAEATRVGEVEEGKYRIGVKPVKGERYGYRVRRTLSMSAGQIATKQEQTYDLTLKVVDVKADGGIVLGLTFDRIRTSNTGPVPYADTTAEGDTVIKMTSQTVTSDTDKKSKIPAMEMMKAYVGRQVLVTTDPRGGIKAIDNIDPIMTATLKAANISADSLGAKQMEMARRALQFEIGSIVGVVFFGNPPDSAVAVGSTWNRVDSVPVAGLATRTNYSFTLTGLKEVKGETFLTVEGRLNASPPVPKEPIEDQGVVMKLSSMTVSGTGTSVLDVDGGLPLSRETSITSVLKGSGSLKEGPEKGKSQPITKKEVATTSITRTSYTPAGATTGN